MTHVCEDRHERSCRPTYAGWRCRLSLGHGCGRTFLPSGGPSSRRRHAIDSESAARPSPCPIMPVSMLQLSLVV